MTGVQNTMLLSRIIVLLTFNGAYAEAEATDPKRRLFELLTKEVSLETAECKSILTTSVFLSLGAII